MTAETQGCVYTHTNTFEDLLIFFNEEVNN